MAPYQFFLLFVGMLFVGVFSVAFNQAAQSEPTPAQAIVEVAPDSLTVPDAVRL